MHWQFISDDRRTMYVFQPRLWSPLIGSLTLTQRFDPDGIWSPPHMLEAEVTLDFARGWAAANGCRHEQETTTEVPA